MATDTTAEVIRLYVHRRLCGLEAEVRVLRAAVAEIAADPPGRSAFESAQIARRALVRVESVVAPFLEEESDG